MSAVLDRVHYPLLYLRRGVQLVWRRRFWSAVLGGVMLLLLLATYVALAMSHRTSQTTKEIQQRLRIVAVISQDDAGQSVVPAADLAARVRLLPHVTGARVMTRQEVRTRFIRSLDQQLATPPSLSIFQEAVEVKVDSASHMRQLNATIGKQPGVQRATYLAEVADKIGGFSSWLETAARYVALLLALCALAVIAAVVRSSVHAEQRTLEAMRNVGGSLVPIGTPIVIHLLIVGMAATVLACLGGWAIDPHLDDLLTPSGQQLPSWLQTGRAFGLLQKLPLFAAVVAVSVIAVTALSVGQYTKSYRRIAS